MSEKPGMFLVLGGFRFVHDPGDAVDKEENGKEGEGDEDEESDEVEHGAFLSVVLVEV
jgi:hypothetical protein